MFHAIFNNKGSPKISEKWINPTASRKKLSTKGEGHGAKGMGHRAERI